MLFRSDAQLQRVAPNSPNQPLYREMLLTVLRMAHDDIFSLRYLRQVVNDNILPLQAFANGCERPETESARLCTAGTPASRPEGHNRVKHPAPMRC